MPLFSDFFSGETIYQLLLTLKFSLLALFISWSLSLLLTYFKKPILFPLFRFLWVLPGFGYALLTLAILHGAGVEQRYSMFSVLIAWVIAGTPYLTLNLDSAIQDLDFREKEVMQSLGTKPIIAFYEFELLRTLPAQLQGLLQQLWLYLTSFSLVMILSGGAPNETLEVGIYTSVRLDHVNFTHACALGLWQVVLLVPLRIFLKRFEQKLPSLERVLKKSAPVHYLNFIFIALLLGGLIFYPQLRHLEWDGALASLGTSLLLSSLVALSSLAWAFLLYYLNLGFFAEAGAWISPMLFTLLWWKFFGFTVMPFFNALCVQIVLFSPWVARSLFPLLRRVRIFDLEAARSLGCTPSRAWFAIEWPRLRHGVSFAIAMVFALSLSEVTAVLLFSKNEFEPFSVWVQNSFMRFRLEEAVVGTCILVLISYSALSLGRAQR